MRKVFLSLAVALLIGLPHAYADVNGGKNCALCTVGMALIEQTAQVNAVPVTNAIGSVCGMLPFPYNTACSSAIYLYGPKLIEMLEASYTPDVICNSIGWCNSNSGKTCRIFPAPKSSLDFLGTTDMKDVEFEQHVA